jgi:hypothetical protein
MEAETVFSPRDDLFNVDNTTQRLLVTDSENAPIMVGVRGVSRPVSRADLAAGGGLLSEGDVWWSLSEADCELAPETNDRIVPPDGSRWRILTQPEMQTQRTRWKCACRRLV